MHDRRQFTVADVLPAAEAYLALPGNGAGGNLHLVLDDMNVDDDHVEFCLRRCLGEQSVWTGRRWVPGCDWPARFDPAGVALCLALLHLSRSQRARLVRRLTWS